LPIINRVGVTIVLEAATQYQPTIRDLPQGERPRERLREFGSKSFSNTELIAILLRTGLQGENVLAVSSRLLARFDGLAGLGRISFSELRAERGLSEAKTSQLMAALELGRRFVAPAPQDVANLLLAEMSVLDQEHLRILLLNTRNEVLGIQEIYVGSVNSSVVRAAEIFRPAVQANAPSIIVVHNHPSGDPAPSSQDVDITNELISAGKLLGIKLLNHVVLGSGNRFVSMNERRFAFT